MKKVHTHYDNLKVSRNAPPEVIKAAYKTLAQMHHPDKRPNDKKAEVIILLINKAYEVLSDPILRAEHDRWITQQELDNDNPINPTYHKQETRKSIFHPPFSRANYDEIALWIKNNSNIFKHATPANIHYIISTHKQLIDDATFSLSPAERRIFISLIQEYFNVTVRQRKFSEDSSEITKGSENPQYSNNKKNELKAVYWLVLCLIIGTIIFFYYMSQPPKHTNQEKYYVIYPDKSKPLEISAATVDATQKATNAVLNTTLLESQDHIFQDQPVTTPIQNPLPVDHICGMSKAPNGFNWPKNSGYLRKMPVRDLTGLSTLTIDNRQNNNDVFVKLFNQQTRKTSRFFLVKAFQSYKIVDINRGTYSVKSKFLNDCSIIESEVFEIQQFETYSGTSFSNINMTLYSALNGNTHSKTINESDFNNGD